MKPNKFFMHSGRFEMANSLAFIDGKPIYGSIETVNLRLFCDSI